MNKKTRKLLTWCLVFSMILTQMLFTNVAFASSRHSGADRYQTALAVVKAGWTTADTVVIARGDGDDLADALAAAPLAYAKGKAPILLTAPDKLPEGLLDTLTTLGVKNVYIVGGTSAVSADVEKALADKVGAANVTRIQGASRVETALAVANAAFPTAPAGVVLAGAYANADALSVSSIAAAKGMPILLVDGEMTADVAAYVSGKTVYAVGGTAVLSDAVVNAANAKRLAGANRYATNAAILGEFELDYSKIYLAKGEDGNMVDALAGSALAALTNSPIVLVDGSNSVAAAKEVLAANIKDASEVVVLGGTMALPDSVAAAVENLKPSTPAELAVKSVTADNLKQIVVTFNKAIDDDDLADKVEDEDNYEILDSDNDEVNDVIDSVSLDADGKVATITLVDNDDFTSKLENQEDYTLVIDEDILGTETEVAFTPKDTELPKAESAEVVGIDTIKVKFSEPMQPVSTDEDGKLYLDEDNFEVNGGDLNIKEVQLVNDNMEANVILYSDLEDKEELTLKVKSGTTDYAGYSVYAASFKMTVVEDTEKPYVVGFEDADRNSVTLIFNEDLKEDADLSGSIYAAYDGDPIIYHTNKHNSAQTATIDGKKLTIEFGEDEKLPAGTAYIYIEEETVQDLWENENAHITAKINIDEDTTKPTVKKIEQGDTEKEIIITFSEDIDEETANDKGNYTVTDADGDVQKISSAALTDSDEVTLTMRDDLASGEYTVAIGSVEDLEGNVMVDYEGKVTIEDKTAIDWSADGDVTVSLYNPGKDDQKIVVDFGEAMTVGDSKYAVDDLDKYILYIEGIDGLTDGNYKVADLYDAEIKAIDNNEKVVIELPYDEDEDDSYDLGEADLLTMTIARVADAEGNVPDDLQSAALTVSTTTTVGYDDEPTATDTDVIEFSYDDTVDFEKDDIAIYYDDDTNPNNGVTTSSSNIMKIAKFSTTKNSDGNTAVKITLKDDLTYDGYYVVDSTTRAVFVVVVDDPESTNDDGAPIVSGPFAVTDSIVPAIAQRTNEDGDDVDDVTVTNNGDGTAMIVIKMEEVIDASTVSKVTFDTEDYDVDSIYVSSDADGVDHEDGQYIVIMLSGLDDETIGEDFGIEQTAAFEDMSGNEVNDLDTEVHFTAE